MESVFDNVLVAAAVRRQRIRNLQSELSYSQLFSFLQQTVANFPDLRTGKNNQYSMTDIGLAAFSVFFTQCPSFLVHQTLMKEARGKSNAETLFKIGKIPTDNHIRATLDHIKPNTLSPVFDRVFESLDDSGYIEKFKFLDGQLLMAFDGTGHFSSNKISCKNCSTMNHKNGETTYLHNAVTPVIVQPGNDKVISLPPEFIVPQDGAKKQDSEPKAAIRWLNEHAHKYSDHRITVLGDDLYSKQPHIQQFLAKGYNYIFTCKTKSHKNLYEWLSLLDSGNGIKSVNEIKFHGQNQVTYIYRFANGVPIRKENSLATNWAELTIINSEGKQTYQTACVTNHDITDDNVRDIIRAHRCRWKIENENNNVLKTRGYHLEHNFGHGKEYLTSLLATMNLLAFLFHTVLHLVDKAYAVLRKALGRRKTFFQDIRALTRYQLFDSWRNLLQFMLDGLEIKLEPD